MKAWQEFFHELRIGFAEWLLVKVFSVVLPDGTEKYEFGEFLIAYHKRRLAEMLPEESEGHGA